MPVVRKFWPRIEWVQGSVFGQTGENSFWGCWASTRGEHPMPVMAQEIAEWEFGHKRAALLFLPVLAALAGLAWLVSPWILLGAPLGYFLAHRVAMSIASNRRALELFGRAVSVQAGKLYEGVDLEDYYAAAAVSGHYEQFAGWTKERVVIEMRKRYRDADEWLRAKKDLLGKAVSSGGLANNAPTE